jgi:hypothetical protein
MVRWADKPECGDLAHPNGFRNRGVSFYDT